MISEDTRHSKHIHTHTHTHTYIHTYAFRTYKAFKARVLPKGTISFEKELPERYKGSVDKELSFKLHGKDNYVGSGRTRRL
jgi:hypothetical protein